MSNKFQCFQAYQNRSRWILLLFCFDILFMVLAFTTAILPNDGLKILTYIFSILGILFLINTAFCCYRNLRLITTLQTQFLDNDYEASAIRILQFHKLLDENLLEYYFQPIISTRTGEIFAYEALMRSNADSFQMTPSEILDIAAKENRLYDIEKRTLFNVLKLMDEYIDVFSTKKLFINSISGHQLVDEDFYNLYSDYAPLFKNIVLEITEATYLDESGINLTHQRLRETSCQLALDDYGTGFSNESNLLNTNPNYIKIDHSILRYINIDTKKQQLVSNLVNFAKHNNIQVIAEGIETYEEFELVIRLGVDYIQGYYTAKPEPTLTQGISEELLHKLHTINSKQNEVTSSEKVYITKNDRVLSPVALGLEMYTDLVINDEVLLLQGNNDMVSNLRIKIPDNHNCRLTLDNVYLSSFDAPTICLGKNCTVILNIIGNNRIMHNGIRVPETSELTLIGNGNLTIELSQAFKTGIGGNHEEAYGNLSFEGTGKVTINAFTDAPIGIGGGYNPKHSGIRMCSGQFFIQVSGYQAVGIGSMNDYAGISIGACQLGVKTEATNAIGIGCLNGKLDLDCIGELNLKCQAKSAAVIGALESNEGNIAIKGGAIDIKLNANKGAGIGSVNSNVNVTIDDGDIDIYAEGSDIVGIGDQTGHGNIKITKGTISCRIYAMNPLSIGNINKEVIIDGGNIHCDFPDNMIPKNSYGAPLVPRMIAEADEFCQSVDNVNYSYEYQARYSNRHPYIKVYLPETVRY